MRKHASTFADTFRLTELGSWPCLWPMLYVACPVGYGLHNLACSLLIYNPLTYSPMIYSPLTYSRLAKAAEL